MSWTEAARLKAAETKRLRGSTNQYTKAKLDGREIKISQETRDKIGAVWKGRKHSEETKKKIAEKARKSSHRRLLKSTREYQKPDGSVVLLDSSWEEILAKRLDELAIEWERPSSPIHWIDSRGDRRNYFPDFWLPQHKIYLDPKNPAAMLNQREKVEWLLENRQDVLFLRSELECKKFCLW